MNGFGQELASASGTFPMANRHGTGTGILRQLIRDYLNAHTGVESARDEHVQFGGAGITVVELR